MTTLKAIFLQITIQPFLINIMNSEKLYLTYAHFSILTLALCEVSNLQYVALPVVKITSSWVSEINRVAN